MIVTEVSDHTQWDEWVQASAEHMNGGAFLHSRAWGAFQESVGRKVVKLVFEKEGEAAAIAQLVRMPGRLRQWYWYCPRGPRAVQSDIDREAVMKALIQHIKDSSATRGAMFLRYDPEENWPHARALRGAMVQPWATRILNLKQSEDDLLANMKPKTRYNIRVAERHDVNIKTSTDKKALKRFLKLARVTAKRQHIHLHTDNYYKRMRETLIDAAKDMFWIAEAEYKKTVIASGLFIRHGTTVTYLHGASSVEHKNVMAPYLLHWRIIQDAKKHNAHRYDLFGVAATPEQEERWKGIIRFKEGFGGERLEFARTQEISLSGKKYALYRLLKSRS